jgi:hypothetical protein
VGSASDDLAVLQGLVVLQASPIYTHQHSKDGTDERVSGVRLLVRAPDSVSPERLTRTLQCHSARALLGQVDRSQLPDDPYFLPQEWLDINVVPENGNLAVSLAADSVAKNLQVLNRVSVYADSHSMPRTAAP